MQLEIFFLLLFLIPLSQVYADTYDDINLVMDGVTVEIHNPITAYQLTVAADGYSTKFLVGDELRKYTFDRTLLAATPYNIDWLSLSSTVTNHNVLTVVGDARLRVTGTILSEVNFDDLPSDVKELVKNVKPPEVTPIG